MKGRKLKLTLAYDGTRYAGWQVQNHRTRHKVPTIQAEVERVLRTILQEPVQVMASGRTDTGVHALAQVAHMATRSAMPRARLLRAVNHLLPPDIAVMKIDAALPAFHAQHDAIRKYYRYRIFTGRIATPFIRPYVHHVRARLNVPLMRREAAHLRGRHDFRAFAREPGTRSTIKTIERLTLTRSGSELQMDVIGNGFLHTMVRSIAGTLIDVGRGRLPAGTIKRMLATRDRRLTGTTAPGRGLTLVRVVYRRPHG